MSRKHLSHNARGVVTGAGGGIGRAFAMELHRRGGRVVCSDINLSAAQETAAMINGAGGQALALKCDVTSLQEVEALASQASAWFGEPANLLVNNAGVGIGGHSMEDISMEDWHWVMNINLWGVIHGCRVFLPAMKAGNQGGIINVASAASFGAAPMMAAYNTTKAAVVALTETLMAENTGTGIQVSALCPTLVKTDVIKNARMNETTGHPVMNRDKAQQLMDRLGHSPESVVKKSLDGLDRDTIHVLPQVDARIASRLKRLSPGGFIRLSSFLSRRLQ
ncbi:MAG: SDR family NAD(P)-dependent oxidoreductase [Alcanivoracaceae bacterium]